MPIDQSATHADAQVTVNPAALDPPAPSTAKPTPRPPSHAARPPARPTTIAAKPTKPTPPAAPPPVPAIPAAPPGPAVLSPTTPVGPTAAGAPARPAETGLPPIPLIAPSPPILPPPLVVASRPAAAAGTLPIAADAQGTTAPTPDGLRVTFAPGRIDISPPTADTIRALIHANPDAPSFSVTSLAAGTAEDLSAARRLSLGRGLAIRALLISEGIASTRIFIRALGNNADAIGTAPPDRADIALGPTKPTRATP